MVISLSSFRMHSGEYFSNIYLFFFLVYPLSYTQFSNMKMNSKTAGIFFLFVCLFIVLFIGQWSNSRGGSNAVYLGQMESFTEGKAGKTTKKPTIVGAPNPGLTTRKPTRNMESFTEGAKKTIKKKTR